MRKFLKYTLSAAALLLLAASARAADPDPAAQAIFKSLMTATVSNDYDGFTSVCDDRMKAALTKANLEGVSGQVAPRAKDGYDSDYLGELNQRGYKVQLWRLRFKSGGDDMLATVSVKDGKAGGFYLH